MASVFARLRVPASDGSGAVDDHGVHAFIVPLRDADGNPAPGVEIRDCGYKASPSMIFSQGVQIRKPREPTADSATCSTPCVCAPASL